MYKKRIVTKDLILDKAKLSDAEDIYENFWKEEDTAKYMLWKPCTSLDEAKERLTKAIEFQKTNMSYFVYEKSSMKAIGVAGMKEIEPGVYEDAGIGFGPKFVGKGYGKQILNALIDYIFNDLKAKKIICSCDSRNIASAKLQQSCGLKYSHSEKAIRKRDSEEYLSDYYQIENGI